MSINTLNLNIIKLCSRFPEKGKCCGQKFYKVFRQYCFCPRHFSQTHWKTQEVTKKPHLEGKIISVSHLTNCLCHWRIVCLLFLQSFSTSAGENALKCSMVHNSVYFDINFCFIFRSLYWYNSVISCCLLILYFWFLFAHIFLFYLFQ